MIDPYSCYNDRPYPIEDVSIPSEDGSYVMGVCLAWVCPVCLAQRGQVENRTIRRRGKLLYCSKWKNPCGHIDTYKKVREEGRVNGLNYYGGHMETNMEKKDAEAEMERITALTRLIEEGQERSYEEWKHGVKRKASVCIAEYLVQRGIRMEDV